MRILVLSKRYWITVLSIISAIVIIATCVVFTMGAAANRLLPIYCVENTKKQIAITFDAAWTADDVDEMIDVMNQYNAVATVFTVGEWIEKYPDAVKKLSSAGHIVANHSDSHKHLDSMSRQEFIDDVKRCNDKIEKLTGKKVLLYRGPYGEYNNISVAAIESLGMYYIQWDCDSLDWKPDYTVDMVVNSALKNTAPGSIMLLHIGAEPMIKALPIILEKLKNDGYEFVSVEDLILKENYEIDHSGRQLKKK